jgi:hypothetical protein
MEELLDMAGNGIRQLIDAQKTALQAAPQAASQVTAQGN